jgi:hypothetical protein
VLAVENADRSGTGGPPQAWAGSSREQQAFKHDTAIHYGIALWQDGVAKIRQRLKRQSARRTLLTNCRTRRPD